MTQILDSLQARINTAALVVVAMLLTVGIIYQGFNTQLQMQMVNDLRMERQSWQERVRRELEQDRQQQEQLEALRVQSLRQALRP